MERVASFRLLTEDEFNALDTKARIEYLRQAIAALDRFKSQLQAQVARDTLAHILHTASGSDH